MQNSIPLGPINTRRHLLYQEVYTLPDVDLFRQKMLYFLREHEYAALLDSNNFYTGKNLSERPYYHSYDLLAGIGARRIISSAAGQAIRTLQEAWQQPCWLFGYLGYEVKEETERVASTHARELDVPDMFFLEPEVVIYLEGHKLHLESDTVAGLKDIYAAINHTDVPVSAELPAINLRPCMDRDYYIDSVKKLIQHIVEGDVYEINFCQQFEATQVATDPFALFRRLRNTSPQPFSAFLRMKDQYVLSASMERYLCKQGNKVISQPIKGTIRRGTNAEEDAQLSAQLLNDIKERAENVMIVDLVRNDLARCTQPGTVQVEELFGIYDFPQVFHMISTVSGELLPDKNSFDAIRQSFPMGSMTGAPKNMAIQLIERYERSRRSIYSGALGYFTPWGDMDLNVVIRTLIYDQAKGYLSLHAGSAITYDSIPEKEYDECLLKISGWKKILSGS